MSTMYEALKKAETDRKKENKPSIKTQAAPESSLRNLAVALAVIFIGLVGWNIYRYQTSAKAKKAALVKAEAIKHSTETAQPLAAIKPAANTIPAIKYLPGTYTLDGIIDAGTASMAVINGNVLKIEDKIEHFIVKKISSQEVELLNTNDNSPLILQLQK
ncbi:MAG: hypothetical protein HQL25_01735 [Candidatus Omnitrophica bacterium]|nr:hypothetical protein [Candidatus Omnitrophota bacterium]